MGNNAIRKKVDFPLYLEVLKQLPEVSGEDIAATKKVFEEIYGEVPDTVTFDIGGKKGDGEIYAKQRITDDSGRSVQTKLYINEYGKMENLYTGFEGSIPWNVARYFMSSMFGVKELGSTKDEFYSAPSIAACGWSMPNPGKTEAELPEFNPYPKCDTFLENTVADLLSPHLTALSNGAWMLYETAKKKEVIGSEGMKQIDGIKALVMVQLHMMTQAVWKDAEAIYSAAKNSIFDAAEVKAVLDQHKESKPATPPLTYGQAMERYETSVKMIRDIAATEAGKEQFLFEEANCTSKIVEEIEHGASYNYSCEYGVQGGTHTQFTIPDPF